MKTLLRNRSSRGNEALISPQNARLTQKFEPRYLGCYDGFRFIRHALNLLVLLCCGYFARAENTNAYRLSLDVPQPGTGTVVMVGLPSPSTNVFRLWTNGAPGALAK